MTLRERNKVFPGEDDEPVSKPESAISTPDKPIMSESELPWSRKTQLLMRWFIFKESLFSDEDSDTSVCDISLVLKCFIRTELRNDFVSVSITCKKLMSVLTTAASATTYALRRLCHDATL